MAGHFIPTVSAVSEFCKLRTSNASEVNKSLSYSYTILQQILYFKTKIQACASKPGVQDTGESKHYLEKLDSFATFLDNIGIRKLLNYLLVY